MPEPPEPLSEEHRRVLALVVEGWTDERIARELGLTFGSMRRRLKEAADLLGAGSRVQLAVIAVERGIVRRTAQQAEEGKSPSSTEQVTEALEPPDASNTGGGTTPAT